MMAVMKEGAKMENNIQILLFSSGQFVISQVGPDTPTGEMVLIKPRYLRLMFDPATKQMQAAIIPMCPWSKGDRIEIDRTSIIGKSDPTDKILDTYLDEVDPKVIKVPDANVRSKITGH